MQVTVENRRIMTHEFWGAFNTLMAVKSFTADQKFKLVVAKKKMVDHSDAVRETFNGIKPDDEGSEAKRDELLDQSVTIDFKTINPKDNYVTNLSAEDLFQLDGFISKR